jgi:hypothetical protein
MKTTTSDIIKELRLLSKILQHNDAGATEKIIEAADRLEEQEARIKRLESLGDDALSLAMGGFFKNAKLIWAEAKETNP